MRGKSQGKELNRLSSQAYKAVLAVVCLVVYTGVWFALGYIKGATSKEHKAMCFVTVTIDGQGQNLHADYAVPTRAGDLVLYQDGNITRSVAAGHWSDMRAGSCRE